MRGGVGLLRSTILVRISVGVGRLTWVDAFTEEDWDTAYAFNVKQTLWLAQASRPLFNANENGGHLIVTSSVAGTRASGSSMVTSPQLPPKK
jgi:NAD(P)-dependent dehydrogenase (short-subunit alcohol dehydrogenase family)